MLFDLLERLSSLTRVWFRQHPLLADLQPIQLSALLYLARCNRYSNTPLAVTEYLGLTKGTVFTAGGRAWKAREIRLNANGSALAYLVKA